MNYKSVIAATLTAVALSACNGTTLPDPKLSGRDAEFMALAPKASVGSEFERYLVDYKTGEPVGTIIVDSQSHFLYYVMPGGKAVRYGVSTGQDAMGWTGRTYIGAMQEWPRWIPPKDMLERWPHLQPTADAGGLQEVLIIRWARELYISIRTVKTRFTAFMAPTNLKKLVRASPLGAFVCVILMRSIFIIV